MLRWRGFQAVQEWFTRSDAMRAAEAVVPPEASLRELREAKSALAVAELALEPPEEFEHGDPNRAILLLLGDCLRRALGVKFACAPGLTLAEVIRLPSRDGLTVCVPPGASLDEVLLWIENGEEAAFDGLSESERDARIAVCLSFVRAVVQEVDQPSAALRRYKSQRSARYVTATLVFLVGMVVGGVFFRRTVDGAEIATGKPFVASSVSPSFGLVGRTNEPVLFDLFFHTLEEDHPWIKIDLERVESVGRFTINNRRDCCAERAIPLVVEVSLDAEAWTQVARRDEAFSDWTATINPIKARHIRISVPRRTPLHLTRVLVWH